MTRKQAEKLLGGPGVQHPTSPHLVYRYRCGQLEAAGLDAPKGGWIPLGDGSRKGILSLFPDAPILDHIYTMLEGVEMVSEEYKCRIKDGVWEYNDCGTWTRGRINDLRPVSAPKEKIPAKLYDQLVSLGKINLSEYERGA